tara:strand:+ start:13 stop:927 length:915 start_codon:yes stop_codon:yes gene_type:complete
MAIRRGPLAVPEDATKVFAIDTQGSTGDGAEPSYRTTFPVDMVIQKSTAGGGSTLATRLTGTKKLVPESTAAEANYTTGYFDYMNGWRETTSTYAPNYGYMWKRAPGYFDVVAATGGLSGGSLASVQHNLGVTPELIIQKKRSGSSSMDWFVTGSGVGGTNKYLILNSTAAVASTVTLAHNASTFTPIFDQDNFIAYLFATCPGVSKVGSYTGTNSTLNVDCGFSNGARFVLLKRTDSGDPWLLHDSARGIVSGNDPYLYLNNTLAQQTGYDPIDPLSSGFTLNGGGFNSWNASGGTYIFYAIA